MNLHFKCRQNLFIILFFLISIPAFTQIKPPVASLPGGKYPSAISITLQSETVGAAIYYTLDGSVPTQFSPRYTAPLSITGITTLRATAFSGNVSSTTTTHTYFININHSFPIAALSFKNEDFFDPATGIYPNYEKEIEVPVYFEFFENNRDVAVIKQDIGVEITGSASAALAQKAFQLKAKKSYGLETMPYQMFGNLPYNSYNRLVLRNSGQDWGITMFRDAMVQSLTNQMQDLNNIIKKPKLYMSEHRPAVVYLNGKYWGIYDVTERMKTPYIEQRFNLKSADYHMVENEQERLNGDSTVWFSFLNYLNKNFSDNNNFNDLKTKIDIDNFLDYHVFNIYVDNQDWPGNNNRRFREIAGRGDTLWRWISYDFDFTFGLYQYTGGWNTGDATPNSLKRLLNPDPRYANTPQWSVITFQKCVENAQFRRDFINRMADMMNTVFRPNRINARIDAYKAQYSPEINRHADRWGSPWGGTNGTIWNESIDKMKAFAINRPAAMMQHIDEQFSEVTGTANVTLSVNPANAGSINFSTLNISNAILPWSGTYFKGVDIPIEAVAAPGFVFDSWSVASLGTSAVTSVNLTGDIRLVANFKPSTTATPCGNDFISPVLKNCPTNINLTTATSCAIATWTEPTATDDCATTPSVTSNFKSGSCFPLGTTVVTYRAFDNNFNATSCSFNVNVFNPCDNDTQAPLIANCPANITVSTTTNCAVANWTEPFVTDNCTNPSVFRTFNSGTCFPIGTTRVTYTATDLRGNNSVCAFNITINNLNTNTCDGNIILNQSFENNLANYENWGNLTLVSDARSGSKAVRIGTGAGGLGSDYYAIQPGNAYTLKVWSKSTSSVNGASIGMYFLTSDYRVIANLSKAVTSTNYQEYFITSIAPSNAAYALVYAWKNESVGYQHVDDLCLIGTNNTCNNDIIAPELKNCPQNINLTTTGTCATASWGVPTVSDNCATTPSVTSNYTSGSCFPIGTTTVTYTASDSRGNKSTCSFNVNVSKQSQVADIDLKISSATATYTPFNVKTFKIIAINNGNTNFTGVKVEFKFPTGVVTGGSAIASVGRWREYCANGVQCFTWEIPTLAANSTAVLDIPVYIGNFTSDITFMTRLLTSTPTDNNTINNQAFIVLKTVKTQQNLRFRPNNSDEPTQLSPIIIQSLSPNPTDNELFIDLESIIEGPVTLHIYDSYGRTTKSQQTALKKGTNLISVDVSNLAGGVYYVIPATNISRNVPVKFVKL